MLTTARQRQRQVLRPRTRWRRRQPVQKTAIRSDESRTAGIPAQNQARPRRSRLQSRSAELMNELFVSSPRFASPRHTSDRSARAIIIFLGGPVDWWGRVGTLRWQHDPALTAGPA